MPSPHKDKRNHRGTRSKSMNSGLFRYIFSQVFNCAFLSFQLATVRSEDDGMFQNTLEYLRLKFLELKSHEDIENRYIMTPLLPRLKEQSKISLENDIHGDDRLEGLMKRIEEVRGGGTWSLSSRIEFLVSMREDIQSFIRDLLPHLEEEEEVSVV